MVEYVVSYQESNPSSCLDFMDRNGFGWIDEDLEAYGPGGFLPVTVGDIYGANYKVVRKLGYGRTATVWPAEDQRFPFDASITYKKEQPSSRTLHPIQLKHLKHSLKSHRSCSQTLYTPISLRSWPKPANSNIQTPSTTPSP